MYVRMCVCMYVCVHTHTYMCVCTHTHTYTHTGVLAGASPRGAHKHVISKVLYIVTFCWQCVEALTFEKCNSQSPLVLYVVTLYRKYTKTLTFDSFRQAVVGRETYIGNIKLKTVKSQCLSIFPM